MVKRRGRRKKRKSPVLWIVLGILAVIFIVAGILGAMMLKEYNSTGEGSGKEVEIVVEQGEMTKDIAAKLKDKDLIKYEFIFYLKARAMDAGSKLRYGTFTIKEGSGLETIIEILTSGGAQKEEAMFTVPEGYTIVQIAQKLESEGFCTGEEFLSAVDNDYDYWFLKDIPESSDVYYRLEGFLYPETYAIADDMTAEDIVNKMLKQFESLFTQEMADQAASLGKSIYQVVTEASLIEKETAIESEKVTIAGVIKNRLDKGMLLQIDPTFLYPLTEGRYDITDVKGSHTKHDSPYNTYIYPGLPPGPIANPDITCIKAALNPEVHEYLYYHTEYFVLTIL